VLVTASTIALSIPLSCVKIRYTPHDYSERLIGSPPGIYAAGRTAPTMGSSPQYERSIPAPVT
jgi:hypothetical protein